MKTHMVVNLFLERFMLFVLIELGQTMWRRYGYASRRRRLTGLQRMRMLVDLVEEEGSDNEEESGDKENETPNIG
jgi:hypothetical protein